MALTRARATSLGGAMLALLALLVTVHARAQDSAPPPAWMTYSLARFVNQGTGAYDGWSDSLRASGRYDLTSAEGHLEITASYRWRYDGDHCEDGAEERTVYASLDDRLYLSRTDLDDYDARADEPLGVWLWIPPASEPGTSVRILERDFRVVGPEVVVVAGVRMDALRAEAVGAGRRDDEYGSFETTFTDTYWFDASTGYFLRSEYVERDQGSSEGVPATFVWTEHVDVSGASYVPGSSAGRTDLGACADDGVSPDASLFGFFAFAGTMTCFLTALFVLGPILLVFGLIATMRRQRAQRPRIDGQLFSTARVTSLSELPPIAPEDSPRFHAFLPHFVESALHAGQPVYVARLESGRILGLGLADVEARIGSIFAKNADACEALRCALNVTEFFTEHRHETLPSVVRAAQAAGKFEHPAAYNVFETYDVLESPAPTALAYDPELVRRMTEADLPELAELSMSVYGVRGDRALAAALATGELGFVARVEGQLAGYAFATVVGDLGRLHSNTVSPEHRGKGVGRELARARVTACTALGTKRLVTEVATWNVASLEVMRGVGFEKTGTMWVESAASARVERKVVRR